MADKTTVTPARRASVLYLIVQLAFLCGGGIAAYSADERSGAGKIWIDLTLQNPADSTSVVMRWPTLAEIIFEPANAAGSAAVSRAIMVNRNATTEASAEAAVGHAPVPRVGQGGEEFIENLKTVLAGEGFTFADGFEITDQASPPKLRMGIDYTSFATTPAASALPGNFEVWVRTTLLPTSSPALHWPIRELAANPAVRALLQSQRGAGTPAAYDTIPENFTLVILPAEGAWLRPTVAGRADAVEFAPIFAVAITVAEAARDHDALRKPRTAANRDFLAAELHRAFAAWPLAGEIAFHDELSAVDASYVQPEAAAWVLRLTGFDPVKQQTVRIDEIQLGAQGRQPWEVFLAHQQVEGKTLTSLIAQKSALEKKLQDYLDQQQPWGVPRFATLTDLGEPTAGLRQQSGVAAVDSRVFRDTVAYAVTWYPVLTTLEASGTYNSDRGGNLSARLAVQTRDFGLGGEAYLANRRRGIFADASSTPKPVTFSKNTLLTWGVLGEYTRENPVRLGTPESFSVTDEESRGGLRWRLEGGEASPAKISTNENAATVPNPTSTRRWKLDVIAGYRHAQISRGNFDFVEQPDGAAPFASTEFVGEWDRNSGKKSDGLPSPAAFVHTEFNLDASPAHRTTASFVRGQFKTSAEISAGSGRWENSLLRLTVSGGAVTEDTPVAWWYRLGGDERMRGFELGELAGRSFAHAGFETGISIGSFFKKTPPTSGTPAAALPFDFRQIRILLGAEHAWIGDPPTFFPSAEAMRGGWSYSLTGEYAGAIPGLPGNSRLALGYGYAPNSSHRSGRVFVTLRVPLSIPQSH